MVERAGYKMVTKQNVCKKTYISEDGSESSHWNIDAVKLRFAFSNGVTHDVALGQFPESIRGALAFFGISEKLGNSYAGAAKKAEELGEEVGSVAEDMFSALFERLELGEFIAARESTGPRIAQMVLAIVNIKAKEGVEISTADVAEKLKSSELRAKVEADVVVMAEVKRIRAEASAKAAAKAASDAEGLVAGETLQAF